MRSWKRAVKSSVRRSPGRRARRRAPRAGPPCRARAPVAHRDVRAGGRAARGDRVRLLEVGQVGGVVDHSPGARRDPRLAIASPCAGGVAGSSAAAMTRVGAVIGAERVAQVHGGDRLAAAGVALGGRARQHRRAASTTAGRRSANAGREPARERRRRRRLDARPRARWRARSCPARGAEPGGRAAEHQPVDAVGGVPRQPHRRPCRRARRRRTRPARRRAQSSSATTSPPRSASGTGRRGTGEPPWPRWS